MIAWVLNLAAEEELERPDAHTPSRRARERLAALMAHLRPLLGPDGVVVDDDTRVPAGTPGRAWCPTPAALRRLAACGARVPEAPPLEVLRRVNHRAFCAAQGQTLEGARFVTTMDALAEAVGGPSATGAWLLKHPLGFAGRGRLRVPCGPLSPADWTAAARLMERAGGAQVEPLVVRRGDFGLHGFLARDGALSTGEPTTQQCDERGTWRGTARGADLSADEERALRNSLVRAADALREAGYFGPFGLDAFRYEGASGSLRFNPRAEINARYSMGWATGMGPLRPDLLIAASPTGR